MIKLLTIDNCVIYINPNYIESIYSFRYNDKIIATKIFCVGRDIAYYTVKETPDQILSLMNENPLNKLRDELDLLDFQNIHGYSHPFYDTADVWRIIDKYIPEEENAQKE